nr:hypothetical protein [Tanacetum cinerariifolium]
VVVLEDVIRKDLYLDDADGVECLLNEEIFAKLARMGYEKPLPKLTFYKARMHPNREEIKTIDAYEDITLVDVEKDEEVQTLFKPDKDVEEPKKKRVTDETLLQESFKKLRAAKVSGSKSAQEIPSNDPKEMSEEDV